MARRPSRPAPDHPAGAERVKGQLPTVEELRRFVSESPGRVGKREVARAFGLGPEHRADLRDLLREMGTAGVIAPAGAKRFRAPGRLAEEMVVAAGLHASDPAYALQQASMALLRDCRCLVAQGLWSGELTLADAAELFRQLIESPSFVEFLTLPAYEKLVAEGA